MNEEREEPINKELSRRTFIKRGPLPLRTSKAFVQSSLISGRAISTCMM